MRRTCATAWMWAPDARGLGGRILRPYPRYRSVSRKVSGESKKTEPSATCNNYDSLTHDEQFSTARLYSDKAIWRSPSLVRWERLSDALRDRVRMDGIEVTDVAA